MEKPGGKFFHDELNDIKYGISHRKKTTTVIYNPFCVREWKKVFAFSQLREQITLKSEKSIHAPQASAHSGGVI